MKKLAIVCAPLLLLSSPVFAELITVACPPPSQISFEKVTGKWYQYFARAHAQILSGNAPAFFMYGESNVNFVNHFDSAEFYRGDYKGLNDLICQYSGRKANSRTSYVTMAEYEYTPTLAKCHFKDGDKFTCTGGEDSCELICEG